MSPNVIKSPPLFEMVAGESQFWREEPDVFIRMAEQVPDGGVALEIGTADGASAALMHDTLKARGISIYSVDKAPSPKALRLLKDTGVKVIKSDSGRLAANWQTVDGRAVDFLFIDGDHCLEGVYRDFFGWLPHMRDNGLVLFHDVDPPARGGVAHLGVRIFVDTLEKRGLLQAPCHEFRFLSGRISTPKASQPPLNAFSEIFMDILQMAVAKIQRICSLSFETALCSLKDRKYDLTSLEACYVVDYLRRAQPSLINLTSHARRRSELLDMIDHGCMSGDISQRLEIFKVIEDLAELSKAVAIEQARLIILTDLLSSLVPWTP